jgi:DNA-directed RNA polymerase subunit omega
MPSEHETMIEPAVEGLLERAKSKFRLVTLGASRARQINAYFGQLGDGLGATIPPQVTSVSRKPLSIAFEEISCDKIVAGAIPEPVEVEDAAEPDGDDAS